MGKRGNTSSGGASSSGNKAPRTITDDDRSSLVADIFASGRTTKASLATALKALHDRNIFHRDLKSANIFQHSDGTFKMGDLNVSKIA